MKNKRKIKEYLDLNRKCKSNFQNNNTKNI